MDVVGTVSFMVAAYGYYKVGIYAADTIDKGVRIYNLCKNAVGYVRRPIRYYLETDNESVDSYPDVPPRPASCSKIDNKSNYEISKNCVETENEEVQSDPGTNPMFKTIADISEFKPRFNSKILKSNREKSISMCSENTEMCLDEILTDVSWVLVKNPDYD